MKNRKQLSLTIVLLLSILFSYGQDIVINEINYNSAPDFDPEDWVELYNNSGSSVDVSNWVFKDDDDLNAFVIPSGTIMGAGTYLILAKDVTAFQTLFPSVSPVVGGMDFGLSKKGELIRLFDDSTTLIDYLEYDDKDPWPEAPDGDGNSLELINPSLDNTLEGSWEASDTATAPHGTPGAQNSVFSLSDDEIKEFNIEFSIYPNPMQNQAVINVQGDYPITNGQLSIYNILGKQVRSVSFTNNTITIERRNLSTGMYIVRVSDGNTFLGSKKLMIQ